jgi:hypothetical protein
LVLPALTPAAAFVVVCFICYISYQVKLRGGKQ